MCMSPKLSDKIDKSVNPSAAQRVGRNEIVVIIHQE